MSSVELNHIFNRLKKKGTLLRLLLFLGFYLSVVFAGKAQQYSLRDQAEIQYQAQLTLVEYESILNLISNSAISQDVIKDAAESAYLHPNTKIFYSQDVLVADNIAPSGPKAADRPSQKIKDYIQEFNEMYVKSDLETVDFYDFGVSNLKGADQLHVRVKYTVHFKGRHKTDPAPYRPINAVAKLKAEKKHNRWVTYITGIAYYDPSDPIEASKGDAELDTTLDDDGTFAAKLSDLMEAQLNQEQHHNDAAIAQSWRIFDEKRFQEYRTEGERAEAARDYVKARRHYSQALLVKPGEPAVEARLRKVNKSIQLNEVLEKKFLAGEYVEAIKAYGEAIAGDPENADLYYGRAKSYEKLNELQTAVNDLSAAIRLDPKYADALSSRAKLYLRMAQPQKALEDYNQILLHHPKEAAHYTERARLKTSLGDLRGALADYEAAIGLDPQSARYRYEKGQLQYQQKQTEEAIRSFTAAIEQDSLFADAYYSRALAYIDIENVSSASIDFEKARRSGLKAEQLTAFDNIAKGYFAKGTEAMAMADHKLALENFIKAVLLAPANEVAWISKGDAHAKLQDFENALQSYSKAIELEKVSNAYYKRALLYRQLRNHEAAKSDFEKFIPLGLQLLSKAESKAGNPQSNLSLEKIAEEMAEGWYMLGHAQLYSGQYNEAMASFDKALDINKGYAQALAARGAAYLGLKNYKKAIKDIEKSMKSGLEDDPWIYLALGDAYQGLGQTDYAISIYSYIIDSVDKGFDQAYIHRADSHKAKKQYQLALQDVNTAMSLNEALRRDVTLITNKGLLELYESRFQEASQSFDQALSLEQNAAWALYGKASVLASQNKMEESLDLYRKAFQTGQIEWSAIKDDPIIKHVSKQKAFKELVDASLRL